MIILYTALVAHIIIGLVGVISAFALLIGFLRRMPKIRALKIWSVITFFLLSCRGRQALIITFFITAKRSSR